MTSRQYNSKALQQYRQKAAELVELRKEVEHRLGTLELSEAQREFNTLELRTKEFEEFRARLGPAGIFLAKYGVEVINDHTVSFVLPKGCSRIEILREAQRLVSDRDLILPLQLSRWGCSPAFTKPMAQSERICIDGHVKGGDAKSVLLQTALLNRKGLERASMEDLAVAFALHWVATQSPLFGWYDWAKTCTYLVRTDGAPLGYTSTGLTSEPLFENLVDSCVGFAARVPQQPSSGKGVGEASTRLSGFLPAMRRLLGW
jgi:hypothetical protein